jgi:hypothetical protein
VCVGEAAQMEHLKRQPPCLLSGPNRQPIFRRRCIERDGPDRTKGLPDLVEKELSKHLLDSW